MRLGRSAAFVSSLAFCASTGIGSLAAQETPRLQPEWGTNTYSVRTIHGLGFQASDTSTTYSFDATTTQRFRTGGQLWFDAPLTDLPAGAWITGLELEGCDTNAGLEVKVWLDRRVSPIGPTGIVGFVVTGQPDVPGCGFFGGNANLEGVGEYVDNFNTTYWVRVELPATDSSTSLGAVRVYYKLQVSPSPATATFADVPTSHIFFRYVEALAASGITAGCGSGNFCPDNPVTRGQMATFLSIALGLHFPY